jgi:hypothetical protein
VFVYFIQREGGGPVKIGKSQHPESRLKTLQQACPEALRVIAVCGGGYPAEKQLHRWFAADRLDGEWFDVSEALQVLLDRLPSWEAVAAGAFCPELLNNERTVLVELYQNGYTLDDLAVLLGVSRTRIHQIVSGYSHKWRRKRWTFDPVTKKNRITAEIGKDRSEVRPEEPVESAYRRLIREHCGIELVLPEIEG